MTSEKNKCKSCAMTSTMSDELNPPAVTSKGFRVGEYIASGKYAKVYRAEWSQRPGLDLACKLFDLSSKEDELWRQKCLKQEMKVVLKFDHKNIIKAYEVIKTRKSAYIFMNFAKNGSIEDFLSKNGPIPEPKAKKWFKEILRAINHIHSKGIAHRDIKPDNFLLDENNTALLSDFGFSCISLANYQKRLLKGTKCGTNGYMSPEIKTLKDGHVYDAKPVDMYAMGVSLYVMLTNKNPFGDFSVIGEKRFLENQEKKKYSYDESLKISKDSVSLTDLLLEVDPKKRITAENAEKHGFVTKN